MEREKKEMRYKEEIGEGEEREQKRVRGRKEGLGPKWTKRD